MSETNSNSTLPTPKPTRLTWWLLLSVILIYGVSFLRNITVFIYSVYTMYSLVFSTQFDGDVVFKGGLIGALFYIFLMNGLVNRKKRIRMISLAQSGFFLFIYGSMAISALFDPGLHVGFSIHQLYKLSLDQMGVFYFFGPISLVQLYKVCILLRKDIKGLFSDTSIPEKPSQPISRQLEDL